MFKFILKSVFNTCFFRLLCQELNYTIKDFLYYTAVRWLSKGNVIAPVFKLMDELKIYCNSQGKHSEHILN